MKRARSALAFACLAAVTVACSGAPPESSVHALTDSAASRSAEASVSQGQALDDPVVARIDAGATPAYLVEAYGSIWVGDHWGNRLLAIDPSTNEVTMSVAVPGEPTGIAVGYGTLWTFTPLDGPSVKRIAPTGELVAEIPMEFGGASIRGMVDAGGLMWIADETGGMVGIDPSTNEVQQEIRVTDWSCTAGMAVDGASMIWYGSGCGGDSLYRIDPRSPEEISRFPVPPFSKNPAYGLEHIWSVSSNGTLSKLDPATGDLVASADIAASGEQLTTGRGAVWVRTAADELVQVDPASLEVIDRFILPVAEIPGGGLTVTDSAVWVANFADGSVWRLQP